MTDKAMTVGELKRILISTPAEVDHYIIELREDSLRPEFQDGRDFKIFYINANEHFIQKVARCGPHSQADDILRVYIIDDEDFIGPPFDEYHGKK